MLPLSSLLVLLILACLILPWVNLGLTSSLRSDLKRLRDEVQRLKEQQAAAQFKKESKPEPLPEPSVDPEVEPEPEPSVDPEVEPEPEPSVDISTGRGYDDREEPEPAQAAFEQTQAPEPQQVAVQETASTKAKEEREPQDWFSKIAIWVGGIALLMAGFFMIKYSIDEGLLTPAVRVWMTTGFGVLLCATGLVIGLKSIQVANHRIGQALSGAGIACLYFAAYAAVHLYGFLTPGQGFAAMLVVTVLAVVLSLKNGAPVALLGLVGGFLTPWLMSTGSNDTALLFSYLFLLFCGAQFLCVRRGWWALLLGSLLGAYIWSGVVIGANIVGRLDNLEGAMIFIIGICLINGAWALLAKANPEDTRGLRILTGVRCLTWAGGLFQGLVLVLIGGFGAVDMTLFSIISVGALLLAVLREDEFIWAAWLALFAVLAATLSNASQEWSSWLAAPLGLMSLFFAVGHWRAISSKLSLVWRSLSVIAALLVVPLLWINREFVVAVSEVPAARFWFGLSVVWAAVLAVAGEHLFGKFKDAKTGGVYSAFAVFLLLFGGWVYVPEDYIAHMAGGTLLLSAIYWKFRGFARAEWVFLVSTGIWAICMLPFAAAAAEYFFQGGIYSTAVPDGLSLLGWVVGFLGLGTAWALFRQQWDEYGDQALSWVLGLVALISLVAAYELLDRHYMPASWTEATVGGGLTALIAVIAASAIFTIRKLSSVHWVSLVLGGLVSLRIVLLHLGSSGAAGESFFFNALLLQFGIPFMAACVLAWQSGEYELEWERRTYQVAAMLLGFIWGTFLVQDYYGSTHLLGDISSSSELYTYSVVWLLLAVAYQAIGLWRDQAAIHIGSLVLLLITVAKVFLVDASELEGLYRVLSFLGLGLVLIGIGFFYNKVVFARRALADEEKPE